MMYMVPLQCFSTVTRTRVTALTVMAVGTRTLQDTHRHSLPRLQHNASWLPEAVCHWSTELRRPSRVNRYRTDCLQAHLSAQLYSYFIIRYMSVWWWYTHTDMYLSDCISKRKGKIYLSKECWLNSTLQCSAYHSNSFTLLVLNRILLLSDSG